MVSPPKDCLFETFRDGVSCKAAGLKNWGSGNGLAFQQKTKACPAFAVEGGPADASNPPVPITAQSTVKRLS
jgi:hypothetical protein